jgi:hypothetical protein
MPCGTVSGAKRALHLLCGDALFGLYEVVHRHADPITTAQPAESVIQE